MNFLDEKPLDIIRSWKSPRYFILYELFYLGRPYIWWLVKTSVSLI